MKQPRNLTRDLLIAIFVISVAVIAPVVYLSSQAQRDISEQFIDNAATRAVAEYRAMAEAMAASLGLVRDWGESGLFSLDDADTLHRLLVPVFGREKMLFGISLADIDGNSYYVYRDGDGWRSSQVDASQSPRLLVVTAWSADQKRKNVASEETDYDPRRRPWFAPTLSQEGIFWTEPYKFYTSGRVGLTASTSYTRKKDQKPVVIAFDILLDELFSEIHKLAPSDNSRVFVFRNDGHLYLPKTTENQSDFLTIASVNDALVREIYSRWVADRPLQNNVIKLQHEGSTWWGGFHPLNNEQRTAWVCVMVPEQDISTQAGERRMLLWVIGFGAVLVAAVLALWISRKHGHKPTTGGDFFDSSDPDTSIDQMIERGEGPTIEFKSTLRMNLHTQKPGKEIELAWLKGVSAFLNTDGGILLLGVSDNGEITGLEQDVFENEDKCKLHFKNLIAKHLGAEFSKYIDFQVFLVREKTVGVVNCKRSAEPVFLKTNKSEAFYIRNGPASDELPVSKVLNYIKLRKSG